MEGLDCPLHYCLEEVAHHRGSGSLVCLIGRYLIMSCHKDPRRRGKVPQVCTNMEAKAVLLLECKKGSDPPSWG